MERILIYLYPVIINLVIGSELLITPTRLTEAGADPVTVSSTLSVVFLISAFFVFLVGRILTERNASSLLIFSGILFFLCFLGFIIFPGIYLQFFWLFVSGIATAFFCAPFQVFMKKIEHGKAAGIIRATSLYSAAWSFGMATGPLLVGLLWKFCPQTGWRIAYVVNAILVLFIVLTVKLFEKMSERRKESDSAKQDRPEEADFSGKPDLALYGWILTVSAFSVVAVVKTLLPWRAPQEGISAMQVGIVIALLYYTHSFTSLLLIRSRKWMYHPLTGTAASIAASAAMILFGLLPCHCVLYPAAIMLGAYSGIIGFLLVFYSLVHPTKSAKYIAVNEVVVGISCVCAPLIGGLIANHAGGAVPFYAFIFLILTAGITYFIKLHTVSRG